jgi:AFG3 family protein
MIQLLGKRPFVGRSDDMDKWLDQHRGSEKSAPPPLENLPDSGPVDGPIPVAASVRIDERI